MFAKTMTALALGLTATGAQAQIDLLIDPVSGEFIIESASEVQIDAYSIEILGGVGTFTESVFVTEFPTPFGTFFVGPLGQTDPLFSPTLISELSTSSSFPIPAGQTSLGSGLFVPSGSFDASNFEFDVLVGQSLLPTTVTIIPEPATVGLFGVAGALALVRRRRAA